MTLALTSKILQRDAHLEDAVTDWKYRSVIGKLNYLEKSTRPDLAYAVHQCLIHGKPQTISCRCSASYQKIPVRNKRQGSCVETIEEKMLDGLRRCRFLWELESSNRRRWSSDSKIQDRFCHQFRWMSNKVVLKIADHGCTQYNWNWVCSSQPFSKGGHYHDSTTWWNKVARLHDLYKWAKNCLQIFWRQ